MNAEKIVTDVGVIFVSYAVVASTFHYAKKAGAASVRRYRDEFINNAQTARSSDLYWRLEPLRAYARSLFKILGIGFLMFIFFAYPLISEFGIRSERIVPSILAFLITTLVGIWAGRDET